MDKKILLTHAMAFMLAIGTTHGQTTADKNKPGVSGPLEVRTELIDGSGQSTINYSEDGHRYRMRLNESKLQELYVDDKKIEPGDFDKYEPLVKRILVRLEKDRKQAEKDRAQAEKDRAQAEKDREQAEKDRAQAEQDRVQSDKDRQQAEKDRAQSELDRAQSDKDREQAEKDRAESDKYREQAEKDRGQAQKDLAQVEKDGVQAEKDRVQAGLDRVQAEKDRAQAGLDRVQAEKDRQTAEIDRKQAEADRKMINGLVDELVNEKIVATKAAVTSILLDGDQLIVNGVKQPDGIHLRFKAKYLNGKRTRINYTKSETHTSISID